MLDEYKISGALYGHSLDVRSICATSQNDIISGSRDKTAKFWKYFPNSDMRYAEVASYLEQKNFVASVLYLEPTEEYPDGLVVTGGNDKSIYVYKPKEPSATFTFTEHSNSVCSLSRCREVNAFLSASWDNTIKYWNINAGKSSLVTFTGHEAAVWAVIQINDGRIVSASADKTIKIWLANGQKVGTLTGHTDCVRCLADLPELNQFLSGANDTSIKLWSYDGENLATYLGHSSFIYSIARCKALGDNSFVSSGEENAVKVWINGENTDTINVPAQSVWSVQCLSNGDIITASSDGVVRIFTKQPNRVDETAQAKYTEELQALARQNVQEIGGYKVSDLPGREALYDPGKRVGQNKMIRENDGVVLYTWVVNDGESGHWEKIGDVLGGTKKEEGAKTNYEGKDYDYVFSVDVEDGKPPLKLPFNKGDDPYTAANAFLQKHMLPADYLEQVVDFILKNSKEQFVPPTGTGTYVDPFTGSSRYQPSYSNNQQSSGMNLDPFTGASSYSTSGTTTNSSLSGNSNAYFPQTTCRSFEMGDPKIVINKIKEFNKRSSNPVGENEIDELLNICNGSTSKVELIELLFRLLEWPDDLVFPVLDAFRFAVRHRTNNEMICNKNGGIILQKILYYLNDNQIDNNIIVALRTVCNLCIYESGQSLVYDERFKLWEKIQSLRPLNKSGQVALSTVLINMTIITSMLDDQTGFAVLSILLPEVLTKLTDVESQFRAYVAMGTLVVTNLYSGEIRSKFKENLSFLSILQAHTLKGDNDLEKKRMNCAKELQAVLNS